ncbi:hypothetical protein Drorol1_Dr00002431 [Drosera rotundifolia]
MVDYKRRLEGTNSNNQSGLTEASLIYALASASVSCFPSTNSLTKVLPHPQSNPRPPNHLHCRYQFNPLYANSHIDRLHCHPSPTPTWCSVLFRNPSIIPVHETTFLIFISSNKPQALSTSPHLTDTVTITFHVTKLLSGISSNTSPSTNITHKIPSQASTEHKDKLQIHRQVLHPRQYPPLLLIQSKLDSSFKFLKPTHHRTPRIHIPHASTTPRHLHSSLMHSVSLTTKSHHLHLNQDPTPDQEGEKQTVELKPYTSNPNSTLQFSHSSSFSPNQSH